jgi:hypothetical protein
VIPNTILFARMNRSALAARAWLCQVGTNDSEMKALRELGTLFCNCILNRSNLPRGEWPQRRLPSPSVMVRMKRSNLLSLAKAIALSGQAIKAELRPRWATVFGGLAISYARVGDVVVVAALVRAAAQLNLRCCWLREAQLYLLDQQQPSGCFGLISAELSMSSNEESVPGAYLRLTVEVLWSLATVGELETNDRST